MFITKGQSTDSLTWGQKAKADLYHAGTSIKEGIIIPGLEKTARTAKVVFDFCVDWFVKWPIDIFVIKLVAKPAQYILSPIGSIINKLFNSIISLAVKYKDKYHVAGAVHSAHSSITKLFHRQVEEPGIRLASLPREGLSAETGAARETCLLTMQEMITSLPIVNRKDRDEAQKERIEELFGMICDGSISLPVEAKESFERFTGEDYREIMVAQALAQVISYCDTLQDETIQIPRKNDQDEYQLINYKITFLPLSDGLPIMVLTPEEEIDQFNPWIVPRGTAYPGLRPGGMASLRADIAEKGGLDERVINSEKHATIIDRIFTELAESGYKAPIVTGHSLGAFMAELITINHYGQIEKSYGFGSPGVSDELDLKYRETTQEIPEKFKKLKIFNNDGDFVPGANRRVIGAVFELFYDSSPATKHVDLSLFMSLLEQGCAIKKVDKVREENEGARALTEYIRFNTLGRLI